MLQLFIFAPTFSHGAVLGTAATDYISVPDTAQLRMTSAKVFTMSMWAYATSPPPGSFRALFEKDNGATHVFGFQTSGTVSGGSVRFGINNTFVSGSTNTFAWGTRVWHNFVGTWDGANIRLYVDGVEDPNSPTALGGSINTSAGSPLYMGGLLRTTAAEWNGALDDLWISSSVVSAQEIKSRYQSRSKIIPTKCIGWWTLDDGNPGAALTGAPIIDACGNGNTGTVNAAANTTLKMEPSPLRYQ